MKTARRGLALSLALMAGLAAYGKARALTSHGPYLAWVGTYTAKTLSKGIYAVDFDAETGKLTQKGVAAESPNPSFLAIHPSGKFVYAVNERAEQSMVSSFAVDAKGGKLTLLNQIPSLGEDPCHLSFDKTGKFLLVANYTSGSIAVFAILKDGRLGKQTAFVKHHGSGPNQERQQGPHAHYIETSPDNRFVFVADLGLDEILIYRFDVAKGALTANDPPFAKLAPGAGPRHVAIHPNGKIVFVVGELNSTVTSFGFNPANGALRELRVVSTLPKEFRGQNDAAEIAVHPSGKWLYVSNRGRDSIALFAIDPGKGTLERIRDFSTGGSEPRHFAIDPTGGYLLAENQNSNGIVLFRIDAASGGLTPTGEAIAVPSPVCLVFLPKR
jgi:6-phosphogluconolactonase